MMTRIEIPASEVNRQEEICSRLRDRFLMLSDHPLALVDTYGCQQNESDSERLRGYLSEMGFGFTDDEFAADVIVINTCAVRSHAEMRILGNVGALNHSKKAKPGQIIALCGCMVQQPHMAQRIKMSYPIVNLVFGPHELYRFPELLEQVLLRKKRVFAVDPSPGNLVEGEPRVRDGDVKAWLSIMYGCNNYCTYCIVPHVRGRERSRRPEAILAEARSLIDAGYKDITLLGQNVNSYGHDLGLDTDFADLIDQICAIPGKFRVRFMTSHPKDATEKLFRVMAKHEKCAKHLHLPVQAGNNRVLKAMNRGYTAEDYLAKLALARQLMPELVVTTDVIVGFPGETNEEFEDTLRLVERARFDAMFTFLYSPREGTPAASFPDPLSREDKQKNFDRLLATSNAISQSLHDAYLGRTVEVLVDGYKAGEAYPLTSRTDGGRLVHLQGPAELVGSFVPVTIQRSTTWALFGALVQTPEEHTWQQS